MAFKDIAAQAAKKIFGGEEDGEEIPDDQTRDKELRSLRRQRRVQVEEFEKEQLKKDIREHQKMRMRETFFNSHPVEKMPTGGRNLLKEGKRIKKIRGVKEGGSVISKGGGSMSGDSPLLSAKRKLKKRASRKGMLVKQNGMLK